VNGIKGAFGCLGAIVVVVALSFALVAWQGGLNLFGMNLNRQVTTHSQQYVQTKQEMILDYYADYKSATDDAHKNAAKIEICGQAALLDQSEYPTQASAFIYANCH